MNNFKSKLRELCEKEYKDKPLVVPLGEMGDEPVYMDFLKISGIFIAGSTGTGKSVLIDDIIHGLMYKNKPSNVMFSLIDPKKIELNEYDGNEYVIGGISMSSFDEIFNMFDYIKKEINFRINELTANNCKSIENYNKNMNNNLPHIFVIVDEGYDIINIVEIRNILTKILEYGKNIGMHLIYSTNSYLKNLVKDGFISKFKYKMTFDLASMEQEKLIKIKDSNWLSGNGDCKIRLSNSTIHFQALYSKDEEIDEIILHSKSEVDIIN